MAATLTVRDETPAGGVDREWRLELSSACLTVRELIRERVYQEVDDYNVKQRMSGPYRGLVAPEALEQTLNASKAGAKPRPIDWKKQYERAIEAFENNQVLILVDDRQAESLDDEIAVGPGTAVTFLRLTLLVGG
jgi:hypothetical protein